MTPLELTAKILAEERIDFRYTDIRKLIEPVESEVEQQEGGTHADEIETSMMLFIAPSTVDMSKAIKDYHPSAKSGLTRDPKGDGSYSTSGIFGDATLATRQKGEIVVRAIADGMLKEIEELRKLPVSVPVPVKTKIDGQIR
jgi:creatinine amidohydrolase